jgi:hypothetical protein
MGPTLAAAADTCVAQGARNAVADVYGSAILLGSFVLLPRTEGVFTTGLIYRVCKGGSVIPSRREVIGSRQRPDCGYGRAGRLRWIHGSLELFTVG